MFARPEFAAFARRRGCRGRFFRAVVVPAYVALLVAYFSLGAFDAQSRVLGAEVRRPPNVVLILADDKYECPAHEAANLREHCQNTAFSWQSQIAGNRGEFRGIAGD